MSQNLILVDEHDHSIGLLNKKDVHELGYLHRAFSIFIFNTKGELLLQQRADNKYHSANKWSNTCCSHPVDGESIENTLQRRLYEEMGINCNLTFAFKFTYKIPLENNLIEHEIDHVYMGVINQLPNPSKDEVKNWCYMNLIDLENDLINNENKYTYWLKICFEDVKNYFNLHVYPTLKNFV